MHLRIESVRKSFAGVPALDDVSFAVYPGEVHMLLVEPKDSCKE